MKKGKLIILDNVYEINFNQNPTLYLEEKIDEKGLKFLTGYQKWNPFKVEITSNNKKDLETDFFYKNIFVIPNNESEIWKLQNCSLNNELNEINFEFCFLN
jgi:hypothetical protein